MNITVPASMVTNDHVYRNSEKGCKSMNKPKPMTRLASISRGPRRNHRGQPPGAESGKIGSELDEIGMV